MACGLPCVVSKIRGNEDLIENEKGGYCVDLENESFNIYINKILELDLSRSMAAFNYNKVSNYSIKKVNLKNILWKPLKMILKFHLLRKMK